MGVKMPIIIPTVSTITEAHLLGTDHRWISAAAPPVLSTSQPVSSGHKTVGYVY
jgi:hypothetical protein